MPGTEVETSPVPEVRGYDSADLLRRICAKTSDGSLGISRVHENSIAALALHGANAQS